MSLLRIIPCLLKPFHKHVETFSPFRASQQDTHVYGWGSITSTNTNTPMELSLHKQKPGATGGPPTLHLMRDDSSQQQVKRSSFLCVQCSMVSHVLHLLMVAPKLEKHRDERNYAFPWMEVQQQRHNTMLQQQVYDDWPLPPVENIHGTIRTQSHARDDQHTCWHRKTWMNLMTLYCLSLGKMEGNQPPVPQLNGHFAE